jgi:hypothetical protein
VGIVKEVDGAGSASSHQCSVEDDRWSTVVSQGSSAATDASPQVNADKSN